MKPQGKVTIFMIVMIVMLSIYYYALPDNTNKQQTTTTKQQQVVNKSEEYEQLRKQLNEDRQAMIVSLQGVISSPTASIEQKNSAFEAMQKIYLLAQKENLVETQIINMGYDDAFVSATETQVNVSVYTDKLSLEEVNNIIKLVKSEFGPTVQVIVKYTINDVN